jgi:outer membrane protein assembly factor BamA
MNNKGKITMALFPCILMHVIIFAQSVNMESAPSLPVSSLQLLISNSDTSAKRTFFYINDIVITGDQKTKSYIIEREVPFKRGDSLLLNELVQKFDLARQQLMNTRLFNDVVVSLKGFKGYMVDVQIDVKERWYLFPIPYFKPVDRNLAEWAKQGYGLNRVNYGLKFSYYNFTGRNDKLKALFITGYTKQIQFSYEQPYADKSLKHGYGINVSYAALKEINHLTLNNEQRFFPKDSLKDVFANRFINEQFNLILSYSYRPAIKTRHAFRFGYNINKIDSFVRFQNPRYFKNDKLQVSYPEISYTIDYNNIDYVAYPLKGFIGDASFVRKGINSDMNLWMISGKGTRGWEVAKNTYYGLQGIGVLKLPFDQPYFNQRLFGYGDLYLRGLEKYVIDGVAGAMVKNTLRREVFNFSLPFTHFKSHDRIPFRIYMKTYADMGFSYNKNSFGNSLENRMLYTAGAGIDLVTFYDFVFRFEYSFNQLGQNGLFLHFKNDF